MNEHTEHSFFAGVRASFGRGLVILVPVVITAWVLAMLFNAIDGIVSPLFDHILGQHIPGLGVITIVILIFFLGILSRNLIGRTLFRWFERLIASIPLARTIYSAMRDVINAFQPGRKGKSFREVVMFEYPRAGVSTIGFVTNEITIAADSQHLAGEMLSVYIPNPPNPTSGMMVLIPRSAVDVLDMTVEDGLKLVLSGGIVTPGTLIFKECKPSGTEYKS
jgi:uncharacterized membrane protein